VKPAKRPAIDHKSAPTLLYISNRRLFMLLIEKLAIALAVALIAALVML
jgi:hypothetical protein